MGEACGTYEEKKRTCTGVWWRKLKERHNLKNPGVDGRISLK